jgi:hypothetical protein
MLLEVVNAMTKRMAQVTDFLEGLPNSDLVNFRALHEMMPLRKLQLMRAGQRGKPDTLKFMNHVVVMKSLFVLSGKV